MRPCPGEIPLPAALAPLQPSSVPLLMLCPPPGCLSSPANQILLWVRIPLDAGAHSDSGLLNKQHHSHGEK